MGTHLLIRFRSWFAWAAGVAALSAGSCGPRSAAPDEPPRPIVLPFDPAAAQRAERELPVAGPWGEPAQGLCARVLLSTSTATETGPIRGAVLLKNVSAAPFELETTGEAVAWLVNANTVPSAPATPHPAAAPVRVTIPPGATHLLGPYDLRCGAGAGPATASAAVTIRGGSVVVRGGDVPLTIAPADWGTTDNGVRLRIVADRTRYATGQAVRLTAFVHNVGRAPLSFRLPAAEPDVDYRGDRITLTYDADPAQRGPLASGELRARSLSEPLLLAPGRYRLRVVLQAEEPPANAPAAWHGRLRSNEVEIEVVAAPVGAAPSGR